MSYIRMIKNKEVLVDRDAGEAEVTITLYSRKITDRPTKITIKEIAEVAELGGAECLGVISGNTSITNRYGEVTGKWVIKIPSTDPENSTMSVLKKRKKRQATKATETTKESTGE